MMDDEFDEMSVVVVDNTYIHYDLLYDDSEETVYIHCDQCDDIVANMSYEDVVSMDEMEMYKNIVEQHRNI